MSSTNTEQLTQRKKPLQKTTSKRIQEVQKTQPQLYSINHNGENKIVKSPSSKSNEQDIKLVMYVVGAAILGVLIYFIWKELSNFWLFKDVGSALGLANKAGKGTSNFFRGLF